MKTLKMRITRFSFFALSMAAGLWLTSCFKSEPLNAECDIEAAFLPVPDPAAFFYNPSDTLVVVPSDRDNIVFTVRKSANLSALAPRFILTPGASISPESGSVHDFSNGPVSYVVTSEDGDWSRTYTVSFQREIRHSNAEVDYYFNDYALNDKNQYYVWTDYNSDGEKMFDWATANPAFLLARSTAKPDEYPTIPCVGMNGNSGIELVTRATGAFGAMVGRRLAAGNLFIGYFDMAKALTETLKATCFGTPFSMKPLTISGYYKFTPGPVYTDNAGNVIEGMQDKATIYSVLYRNHDADGNPIMLYGDDVQSSPYVVAKARIVIDQPTEDWHRFEIPFEYYSEVDPELLDNNGYSLTIVASSSLEGEIYCGAVDSRLSINNFHMVCDKIE